MGQPTQRCGPDPPPLADQEGSPTHRTRRNHQRSSLEGATVGVECSLFKVHRPLCATHHEKRNGRGVARAARGNGPAAVAGRGDSATLGSNSQRVEIYGARGTCGALRALGDGLATREAGWRSSRGPSPPASLDRVDDRLRPSGNHQNASRPLIPPSHASLIHCPHPASPSIASHCPSDRHRRVAQHLCADRPRPARCIRAHPPSPRCGSHRTPAVAWPPWALSAPRRSVAHQYARGGRQWSAALGRRRRPGPAPSCRAPSMRCRRPAACRTR